MLKDMIIQNRSYRRFYGDHQIDRKTLEELVDLARLSASGRNLQPLKYFLSCDTAANAKIYDTLAWAGYFKDWDGPDAEERPTAYIIMLIDKDLTAATPAIDQGIASQSILLGAVEQGLGGCIIASVKKNALSETLNIPSSFEIALVIAIGKPKEEIHIVPVQDDGDIKYYRDEKHVHYVPKRSLKDIII